MQARLGLALLILLGVGCTTIYEELPTQASSNVSSPTPVSVPIVVTPTTLPTPGPTPAPTAAPQPTPTPSSGPTPTPSPGSTPRPAPTPTPASSGSIHHVRVGFFGFSCPTGVTQPRNGLGELPVGCRGFVTATPKDSAGHDVPESVHGPSCDWQLVSGHGSVELSNSGVTVFNKDLKGVAQGSFQLCATVRGVRGCLNGTVTPGL